METEILETMPLSCTVIPKTAPKLQKNIQLQSWDIINRTISLSIQETKEFCALQWLHDIRYNRKSTENSAFQSNEPEYLDITFSIRKLRFLDINAVKHTIDFVNSDVFKHDVVLTYAKYEKINVKVTN